jgi:hypothetical protein
VELLLREEVTLLLGSLTACGFLVLGILDVLWPPVSTRPRAILASPTRAPAVQAPAPPQPFLPPPPPPLTVGRLLLERARAEGDLERRVTMVTRAVAGLSRSALAAPNDGELAAMLAAARAFLWETWEGIALARLAAAMPWGATTLSAPPREQHIAALSRIA